MRIVRNLLWVAFFAASGAFCQAPTWDTSGNGLVKGLYYFREVIYVASGNAGGLGRALSIYGNMTFDGNGGYTISNATLLDSNAGAPQTFTGSGTYSLGASGFGFVLHPLSTATSAYNLYTLCSGGVLVGSTTDNGFNDLFIAAPVPSPQPTVSFFRGSYTVAGFFPSGDPTYAADTLFQLNPDGAGNLGTVSIGGYFGGGGTARYTQSTPNVKYIFSNGAANIMFPQSTNANFYSGNEYMYFSPDGNFVFGGAPSGYDIFVGVKNGSTANFGGLYYEAGLDLDATSLFTGGYALLDAFYGSFNAVNGNILGHQRLFSPVTSTTAEGFTYSDTFPASISGATYTTASGGTQYYFGADGAVRIGFGVGPALGIQVALRAPVLTGSGVFLNPTGISNAASSSPFTAGISNGEFIVLYGSNLAPSTQVASALPFPTKLNGVEVTINGLKAPIYYVSSGQISVIVPYGIVDSIANIQVTNNGVASNSVSEFVNITTPGLFTLTANGLGSGAIEHVDGSVVSASNPAKPGETVAMFVSGLGNVSPAITEGTAGPVNPLSFTSNNVAVYIGGRVAAVPFQGLAPYLAGLYQLNVTIPLTAPAGDNVVEIDGPDSQAFQGTIAVGTATGSAIVAPLNAQPAPKLRALHRAARVN